MLCLSYQKETSVVFSMLFSFFTGIILISTVMAVPTKRETGPDRNISHDQMNNYLMEFGYLPKSNTETGNLRTEEQLKEAIRKLQRFGNVPVTGELDENTRKLVRKPRCGVPDERDVPDFSSNKGRRRSKRYVIQGEGWGKTDLTWSLVNQTMATLDAGQVRRVIRDALNVWESNSMLKFNQVYDKNADIQVLFAKREHGDGYDFDGRGNVLAHAFYPDGGSLGGDAHFDAEEKWNLNEKHSSEYTNLLGVAVHEFGHSLGLGHTSVEDAIMFPWYNGYKINGDLPDDDRIAIQHMYGARSKWGPYNRQRPIPTTTTTTTTTPRPRVYYPERRKETPYSGNDPRNDHGNDPRDHGTRYPYDSPRNPYYPREPHYPQDPRRDYPRTQPTYRPNRHPETPPTRRIYPARPTPFWNKTTTHHPRHKITVRPRKIKPDTCNISYDAISIIRGELFIFKDNYLWRIGSQGLYAGYPHEIRRLWQDLPENFTKIDAVYENRNKKIVFFIDRQYYVFNSNTLEAGYPKPLTNLGLPPSLPKIDAAFIWGHNKNTYFFSGSLYWRFDEDLGKVQPDYPRDMSIWQGIGYHIDTAFQHLDGKTYFFKGKGYWQFNDNGMKVAHDTLKPSAHRWMRCPHISNEIDEFPRQKEPLISDPSYSTANQQTLAIKSKWQLLMPLILLSRLIKN